MTEFGWIALGCLILFALFFFWLGWTWRASLEARRQYRETHPKYMDIREMP